MLMVTKGEGGGGWMKEKSNKIKQPPHLTPHLLLKQHHNVTAVFSPVSNEDTED